MYVCVCVCVCVCMGRCTHIRARIRSAHTQSPRLKRHHAPERFSPQHGRAKALSPLICALSARAPPSSKQEVVLCVSSGSPAPPVSRRLQRRPAPSWTASEFVPRAGEVRHNACAPAARGRAGRRSAGHSASQNAPTPRALHRPPPPRASRAKPTRRAGCRSHMASRMPSIASHAPAHTASRMSPCSSWTHPG